MARIDPASGKSRSSNGRPNNGGSVSRLRRRAGIVSLAAIGFGCLYFFVRQYFKDEIWRFDLPLVNKSLGTAALFLISLSMLATGISYFSRRSPKALALRKYYGLAGFWTALVHGTVTHLFLPAAGLLPERKAVDAHSDAPGLAALVLFGLMAVLSNSKAVKKLGADAWRKALRYGGYAGLILAGVHAAILKGPSWTKYLRTFDSVLPSLSLPVVALAAATLILRLAVWVSRSRSSRERK